MDTAVALRVAVWLHRLDMAGGGEALASESLEAGQHYQGPLLESFLTPRTSSLTYQQVVDQVQMENRRATNQSLRLLQERHTHEWEALEGLIKAHGELDKADKVARKSLKKEIDQRCKGLEKLKERGSSHGGGRLCHPPSQPSPVFHEDDDLLLGLPPSGVMEVESGLAHLLVSAPRGLNREGEEASP